MNAAERRAKWQADRDAADLKEARAALSSVAKRRDLEAERAEQYRTQLVSLIASLEIAVDGARAQLDTADKEFYDRKVALITRKDQT